MRGVEMQCNLQYYCAVNTPSTTTLLAWSAANQRLQARIQGEYMASNTTTNYFWEGTERWRCSTDSHYFLLFNRNYCWVWMCDCVVHIIIWRRPRQDKHHVSNNHLFPPPIAVWPKCSMCKRSGEYVYNWKLSCYYFIWFLHSIY